MKGSILCLQSSAQAQSNISFLSHRSRLFILVLFIFLNVIRVCSTHAYMLDDLNLILMLSLNEQPESKAQVICLLKKLLN